MKLLGISAGRKMGNSEILLKEALMAAEATGGIETEIIRLHDLKIKFCTGCEACTHSTPDNPEAGCVIKDDDMSFLKKKLDECDGLIISSPIFMTRPPGIFFAMNERFLGFGPKYLMDVYKRKRAGAVISIGGTDWVQMAMPMLMMPFFMLNIRVVDTMQVKWASGLGQVLAYDDYIIRAAGIGKNIAQAMKTPDSLDYMGDDKGACPYCHSNLLLAGDASVVSCPLCDIRGDLRIEGGQMKIEWREDDIKNIRWEPAGNRNHIGKIKENHVHFDRNKEIIRQRIGKYADYQRYARP